MFFICIRFTIKTGKCVYVCVFLFEYLCIGINWNLMLHGKLCFFSYITLCIIRLTRCFAILEVSPMKKYSLSLSEKRHIIQHSIIRFHFLAMWREKVVIGHICLNRCRMRITQSHILQCGQDWLIKTSVINQLIIIVRIFF